MKNAEFSYLLYSRLLPVPINLVKQFNKLAHSFQIIFI